MTSPKRVERAPRLNFDVTEEHISTAKPKDSGHCMIADALADAMPNAQMVSVDLATIRFTDPLAGRRYIYLTPPGAQLALIAFDRGDPVEPFHITASAAQMVLTGAARKARRAEAIANGETPPRAERATVQREQGENGSVGVKVGGMTPPLSELATGAGVTGTYKGRRREYGLRALIR